MFDSKVSSKRSPLPPQRELELVHIYLEQGRIASKDGKQEIALVLCEEAEASLLKMKKGVKAAEAVQDVTGLRRDIGRAFFDLSQLLDGLTRQEKAKESYKRAQEWGYTEVESLSISSVPSAEATVSLATQLPSGVSVAVATQPSLKPTNRAQPPHKATTTQSPLGRSATIDVNKAVGGDFFTQDKTPPVIEYKLPEPDERLVNTHQLVYCLGLLRAPPSPDDPYQDSALHWVKATRINEDEQERLNTLTTNLVRAFIRDELKGPTAIAEVACIAPFLNMDDFRCLLGLFIGSIENSTLLDIISLEGLAKLVQGANEGYLEAADLVRILEVLNTRLQSTHQQTQGYIYQLMMAVSHVLDAMADCKVEGLDRVTLHERLSDYINKLKGNSDPHMVYLAAYAFQALECVPDNESPWQATKRRTGNVLQGVLSLVKAVKGLDVNSFLEGMGKIEEGLDGVATVFQTLQDGYDSVTALVDSGQGLFEALKDSLSFDRKRSWYSALRGIDRVLRDGQLSKFRALVLEAPCRRGLAFQWGVCQRLGDLAANPAWDAESREDALEFLAEIYENDAVWGQHAHVKQKILDILLHLQQQSESVLQAFDSAYARKVLQRLEHNGDAAKQALYSDYLKQGQSSHPLKVSQPPFATLSLLDRVQNKPDVEEDLRKLRQQRLKGRGDVVYIPPRAKANLKASDDVLFDLTEKLEEFLASNDQKVLLLLGDSGSGKSTFNREIEHNLWQKYEKAKSRIPLYINLSAIERPEQDMIVKQLRKYELSDSQIRELKAQRKFVLICDGYDESQEKHNLYTTNRLNQTGEWQVQMVISCRSEYIGLDYRDLFQPSNDMTQFQEAVIAPFSRAQVDDYLAKYVITKAPLWTTKQYVEVLDQIPSLQELVKNPFLLTLSLEVLPRLVDPGNNLTATKVTRVTLYDEFVVLWLEQGKKRLGNKDLNPQARADFDRLTDEGFTLNGITFLKDMASAIYKNQAGNPVVTYSRKRDQGKWKEAFFSRENENQLLLEASPLTRSGIQYRFVHKSLLEYFFSRSVFEPQEGKEKSAQDATPTRRGSISSNFSFDDQLVPVEEEEDQGPVASQSFAVDHPLSWRNFVTEPSILDFLSDRVQQEPVFKEQLLAMIEDSKSNKEMRKAAANAISILVRAGVRFNGADLRGVQIPRADLSGGQFDTAKLEGADLRKTNLRNTWIRRANFRKARMTGVQFGEWPYLEERVQVHCCVYSPDGKTCVFGLEDGSIKVYETMTWAELYDLQGHRKDVESVVFSPTGHQIASGSFDKTVRLWNSQTGEPGPILNGHTRGVASVAYSPSGHQIAAGGNDTTVRLWDTQTCKAGLVLNGHTGAVLSVVYSPSGHQIASGSFDFTVRLWDAQTGAPGLILNAHTDFVLSVAYSPSGHQIASGSGDKTVRLWNSQTGEPGSILSGHTAKITSVVYSPSGDQMASGGNDGTVRLWDPQTAAPGSIFIGHTNIIRGVAYSPSGHQIASGGQDKTVRLWDSQTGAPDFVPSGHTDNVRSVAYSPSGDQIASGSDDCTVRLWDTQTGRPGPVLYGHTKAVVSVVYSPSGHQIASGSWDSTVQLWDAFTGAAGPTLKDSTSNVTEVVYSPSGHQIAAGSLDNTVRLWDTETGEPGPQLSGHTRTVKCVVYSPSGHQIASGSLDDTVRLWDPQAGGPGTVLKGHTSGVRSVAYSPNGQQIASCSEDFTVRLWDAQTCEPGFIFNGHTNLVDIVVYSASGHQIASGSWDKTVRLWDTQTGAPGPVLSGHTGWLTSVVYSPSGDQVASGSDDKTARVWDAESGQCLVVIKDFHGTIWSSAWKSTPSGTFLATGCGDKNVRVWRIVEEDEEDEEEKEKEGEKGGFQAVLQWSSAHDQLAASDACLDDVRGLSRIDLQLLRQRGAVGDPEPLMTLQAAGSTMSAVVSAATKFKQLRNGKLAMSTLSTLKHHHHHVPIRSALIMKHIASTAELHSHLATAGSRLVIVDFFATWCGPCQTLAPILEGLEKKHSSTLFAKVDVDKATDCASEHKVTAMPTIVFLKNKVEVGRVVGANLAEIQSLIKKHEGGDAFSGAGQTLGGGSSGGESSASSSAAAAAASGAAKTVEGPGGSCQIQVRLLDGSTIRGDFEPTHTVKQVHDFVLANLAARGISAPGFTLITNFPKVVFENEGLQQTLQEAKLTPRAQLIVKA
ncbi:unnamed protein product [Mortierella alpina]